MEFGCFVLTTANDGKLYPTILNSRYLLKYYSKPKLVPVSKEQKSNYRIVPFGTNSVLLKPRMKLKKYY